MCVIFKNISKSQELCYDTVGKNWRHRGTLRTWVLKTISIDISGRFYEKRKLMHGYFSLEHIRYWIFYIESFYFLVWVFVPLQNKILLFKVKFHMYMCSLVMHYYENINKLCRCIFVCHVFSKCIDIWHDVKMCFLSYFVIVVND